ncbi:EF-P lysine aminoacylase GenX [Candidatus Peregrinibacteria bacterium]|nr:EF-P lysine aminoacylase GenX [Candidatus Peregrinibacteria bacterium]
MSENKAPLRRAEPCGDGFETKSSKLVVRAKIIRAIREFFWSRGFIETDTPCMVRCPGMEPHLNPFKTRLKEERGMECDMYLITSPEYAMKRLLAAGWKKIFQITRSFRNGEIGPLHNPEFAILEWYRAGADYNDIMKDTQDLVCYIAKKVFGRLRFNYAGREINLALPWQILTTQEAFEHAGISRHIFENEKLLRAAAIRKGYKITKNMDYSDVFFLIFLNEIERHLGAPKPTILKDYPISMAALARAKADNPKYAERFELYIAGLELANAFSELTDFREQRARLISEQKLRRKLNKEIYPIDDKFISALEYGMPRSGGIALGIDRLVMFFTGAEKIDEIMFFSPRRSPEAGTGAI